MINRVARNKVALDRLQGLDKLRRKARTDRWMLRDYEAATRVLSRPCLVVGVYSTATTEDILTRGVSAKF